MDVIEEPYMHQINEPVAVVAKRLIALYRAGDKRAAAELQRLVATSKKYRKYVQKLVLVIEKKNPANFSYARADIQSLGNEKHPWRYNR